MDQVFHVSTCHLVARHVNCMFLAFLCCCLVTVIKTNFSHPSLKVFFPNCCFLGFLFRTWNLKQTIFIYHHVWFWYSGHFVPAGFISVVDANVACQVQTDKDGKLKVLNRTIQIRTHDHLPCLKIFHILQITTLTIQQLKQCLHLHMKKSWKFQNK